MKYYIINDDGVYYLDVFYTFSKNTNVKLGTLIFDTKRDTYYLIPTISEKYDIGDENSMKMKDFFIFDMKSKFLKDMAESINPEKRTGNLVSYAKTILERKLEEFEIISVEKEEDENKKKKIEETEEDYMKKLRLYNQGHYPEYKMFR